MRGTKGCLCALFQQCEVLQFIYVACILLFVLAKGNSWKIAELAALIV